MPNKEKKELKRFNELREKLRTTPLTVKSGPILRNPNTEKVIVSVLNEDDRPQTATVSVADTSMCPPFELPKEARICGKLVTDPLPHSDTEIDLNMVYQPVTVKIPPKQVAIFKALLPPCSSSESDTFEVNVTGRADKLNFNIFGVNQNGAPEIGNTVMFSNPLARALAGNIDVNASLELLESGISTIHELFKP